MLFRRGDRTRWREEEEEREEGEEKDGDGVRGGEEEERFILQ